MARNAERNRDEIHRQRQQVLRDMLEDRRQEIQDRLRSIRETLPSQVVEVRDSEEQSVDDFVKDIDFALMEMKSETLGLIDEALRALAAGTYGVCAECGAEISEARLKALPFATLCRHCQEARENEAAEERTAARQRISDLGTEA
jgi:DnaK suppressor protein